MGFHPAQNRLVQRVVLNAKIRLNNYPRFKTLVSDLRFRLWKMQVRLRAAKTHSAFDSNRTCWADPVDIKYIFEDTNTTLVARKYANRGKIRGGDWDELKIRFEDTDHYQGFSAHFLEGVPWERTQLYKRVMKQIEKGDVVYGCNSREAYEQKCRTMDRLFDEIKQNGYQSQESIARTEVDPYKSEDEISVCIGRNGDLLFEDGRHRLAIAKILGLRRIPVKITMVHQSWNNFRMEILDYARQNGGRVYQNILHPDLANVPAIHGDHRLEIIRQHLPSRKGAVLDIGAHWGYWSQQFNRLGFACHAVESSARNVYFMKALRRATRTDFEIHDCSIFDYKAPTCFGVVLALSIFHHFIKEKGSFQKLKELLARLDMNTMFFEPHLHKEPTMAGAYVDFTAEEFVKFILENSCLSKADQIGKAWDGRPIYLLQR